MSVHTEVTTHDFRALSTEETGAVSGGAIGYIIKAVLSAIATDIATRPDNPWNVGKNPKPCGRGNQYKC